jgi:hypothetical protein
MTSRSLEASAPITYGRRPVGRVVILGELRGAGNRWVGALLISLAAGAIAAVVGLIVAWRLQRQILRPIFALTGAMGDVREKHAFDAQVAVSSDDEIAELVDGFNAMLTNQSAATGVTAEELQARLMGRWANGDPLTLSQTAPPADIATLRNDFDYAPSWEQPGVMQDHVGQLCPVGAHIRRTNPRTARVAGQRHARRLLRRGMPTHWLEGGTSRKGLLGLFICGSLERQFEFIQRQWILGDLAASGITDTQDPIAGQRDHDTEFRFFAGGRADQARTVQVPPLVTTRGSVYLFMPGIGTMRHLDEVNADTWRPAAQPEAVVQPAESAIQDTVQAAVRGLGTATGQAIDKGAQVVGSIAANLFGPPKAH